MLMIYVHIADVPRAQRGFRVITDSSRALVHYNQNGIIQVYTTTRSSTMHYVCKAHLFGTNIAADVFFSRPIVWVMSGFQNIVTSVLHNQICRICLLNVLLFLLMPSIFSLNAFMS